ncbi:hypothetical protein JCM10207_003439 [Rhodosporidiobolus poonsookiae]
MAASAPSTADETVWPSNDALGRLSRTNAAAYLERINLPGTLLDSPPSLDLLRSLQSQHMLTVPFESTTIHVPDWHDLSAPVSLGGGEPVALGERAYRHLVELRRGGYCFSGNSTFAALLRYFGFRVSECSARVNAKQRKDPEVDGYDWDSTSHQVSIVDWEGSDGRFLVDVAFGANCAYPIPFHNGATQTSIPSADLFRLTCTPRLPGSSAALLPDSAPYWTLWRQCYNPSGTAYWSPIYAFLLQSVPFRDFRVKNHWQSTNATARFRTFFVATRLHDTGERTTLMYLDGMTHPQRSGEAAAKLSRTEAPREGRREEELRTEWVPMRVGEVREVLEREFGMRFPDEYGGN